MRVCMLVKNSFEFDARVTKEARSLIAAGHDVTVIALHVPGVTAQTERRPDGINVVRVERIYGRVRDLLPDFLAASTTTAGGGHGGPSTDAPPAATDRQLATVGRRLARWVLRLSVRPVQLLNDKVVSTRMEHVACQLAPDVVHAHDLNTLAVGVRVAQQASARLVYDAHELHTARNDSTPWSRFVARRQERRGIVHADAVITATSTWAAKMADAYGTARPIVIRNLPARTQISQPVDLRARLGLAEDVTILLYQGSVQTNRGIEQTLGALPHLSDCVLVVCGYGAHRPVLEERGAAAGLSDRVRFDGPVPNDELIGYSAGADIGLCLIIDSSESYRTSLPNKLFEYLMAGIPVVASDFPEMGAVVRETGAGEVCAPRSPAEIAAAIDRLRAPERYAEATAAARSAAEHLHWGTEEQQLLDLYATLTT